MSIEENGLLKGLEDLVTRANAINVVDGTPFLITHTDDGVHGALDMSQFLLAPVRAQGIVEVLDIESFVRVCRHNLPGNPSMGGVPVLYVGDGKAPYLQATFNGTDSENPGWDDFGVRWAPSLTREMEEWINGDQKPRSQEAMARFLEDHDDNLSDTRLIEAARGFKATKTMKFVRDINEHSGDVHFLYEQETTAGNTKRHDVSLPEDFSILVTPWVGMTDMSLECKMRYSVEEAGVTFSYRMLKREDALDTLFEHTVSTVLTDDLIKTMLLIRTREHFTRK